MKKRDARKNGSVSLSMGKRRKSKSREGRKKTKPESEKK